MRCILHNGERVTVASKSTNKNEAARRALAGSVLAALALSAPLGAEAATPRLVATVGPGFTISLKTPAGQRVSTLKRGAYAITVRDKATIHDFRLRGPGVNKVFSSVAAVGTKTANVRLKPGTYRFLCQPHATVMHGSFVVR